MGLDRDIRRQFKMYHILAAMRAPHYCRAQQQCSIDGWISKWKRRTAKHSGNLGNISTTAHNTTSVLLPPITLTPTLRPIAHVFPDQGTMGEVTKLRQWSSYMLCGRGGTLGISETNSEPYHQNTNKNPVTFSYNKACIS